MKGDNWKPETEIGEIGLMGLVKRWKRNDFWRKEVKGKGAED